MNKDEVVARAKREILADMRAGKVPTMTQRFAMLHDYVDANGYGGFFEMDFVDDEGISEKNTAFFNAVQDELDLWLIGRYPDAVRAELMEVFGRAMRCATTYPEEDNDQVLDAMADAFSTAENYARWMYQDDQEWFSWQLKATPEEIITEGLKRALARLEQS